MLNISELYVKKSVSLKTALSKLDQTALGVLFLVDEEDRFLRTVTDGDVRRLLLKKCTLDSYLKKMHS